MEKTVFRYKKEKRLRYEHASLYTLGIILLGLSLVMIPSLVWTIYDGDPYEVFLWPAVFAFVSGLVLVSLVRMPDHVNPLTGLFMLGMVWFVTITFGAIPFILAGMAPVDAIFESCSGFTTTGATIMTDIESWPNGILLWRSMTQWVGGIAIIIIFLLLMPMVGFGSRNILENEMTGSGSGNFSTRMKDAAKQFAIVYIGLSAIMAILLTFMGIDLLSTLCMTFSSISTGGFLNTADSMAGEIWYVKWVVILFMFLGGVNFYLHFRAINNRDITVYFRNKEFTYMLAWFFFVSVVAYALISRTNIMGEGLMEEFYHITDMVLMVVSAGTSTGFVGDLTLSAWPLSAIMLLFLISFVGASSGSTAGGVKISRIVISLKYLWNGVKQMIYPRGVFDVKIERQSLDDSVVSSAVVIFLLFMMSVVFGSAVLVATGLPFLDSVYTSISALCNTGLGIGAFAESYGEASNFVKVFITILMWVGRLEITAALALLTPSFWKEFLIGTRKRISKL
jgi:trk system potassium uptake protein TrkH